MNTISRSNRTTFSHHAAQLSWVCPLFILLLVMFGRHLGARVIAEVISLLMMLAGLLCGVVALIGMRAHGRRGILLPAILGILISSLFLFIFVKNVLAAKARAEQKRINVQWILVQKKPDGPRTGL
jgi:hypothetical protein